MNNLVKLQKRITVLTQGAATKGIRLINKHKINTSEIINFKNLVTKEKLRLCWWQDRAKFSS